MVKFFFRSGVLLLTLFFFLNNTFSQWQETNGPTPFSILCYASCGTRILAGTRSGIVISDDSGENWEILDNELDWSIIRDIYVKNDTVYAISGFNQEGLYVSTDKGESWNLLKSGYFSSVSVAEATIILSGYEGLYKSIDGGQTWINLYSNSVHCHAHQGSELMVGDNNGIYRSSDFGESWDTVWYEPFLSCNDIIYFKSAFYAGVASGVYKTSDHGSTWDKLNAGDYVTRIDGLFVYDSVLFVSASSAFSLVYSRDFGQTWSEMKPVNINYSVCTVVNHQGLLFIGSNCEPGIYMLSLSDSTWQQKNKGIGYYDAYCFFQHNNRIYMGTSMGLYYLSEDGNVWQEILKVGTKYQILDFAMNDVSMFALTTDGFLKSTDGGENWYQNFYGLDSLQWYEIHSIAIKGDTLFIGTNRGVYRTYDNGSNWCPVNNGLPYQYQYIRNLLIHKGYLLAATEGGLYRSSSNGDLWEYVGSDIPGLISSTAMFSEGDDLFMGVDRYGFYESNDNGLTWKPYGEESLDVFYGNFAVKGDTLIAVNQDDGLVATFDHGKTFFNVNDPFEFPYCWNGFFWSGDTLFGALLGRGIWKRSIQEMMSDEDLSHISRKAIVFPNPASDFISVQIEENSQFVFHLFDQSGKLIMKISGYGAERIPIAGLSSGLYLVYLITDKGVITDKLSIL